MVLREIALAVLTALLGGGIGAAIVSALNERWKLKFQRKVTKEDREAIKADRTDEIGKQVDILQKSETRRNEEIEKRLKNLEAQITAQSEALKLILLDRILWLGQGYIEKGEISYDDRRRFHAMHECYHTGLGGNGDADLIVAGVDDLILKH